MKVQLNRQYGTNLLRGFIQEKKNVEKIEQGEEKNEKMKGEGKESLPFDMDNLRSPPSILKENKEK